jgi:hypothetical protein
MAGLGSTYDDKDTVKLKKHSIACASWFLTFLPYNIGHVYFCRIFYVYVSFSFYVAFLAFPRRACVLLCAN